MKRPNCSGDVGAGSAPSVLIFSATDGSFSAFVKASFSLLMTSAGVPEGATSPNQPTDSKPAMPLSASVGTSGQDGRQRADETPTALSLPSRINCLDAGISSTAKGTCPARTSTAAGAVPRYG